MVKKMVRKKEYDFLTWTSFPSSAKLYNDEGRGWVWAWWGWIFYDLPVTPGAKLAVKVKAKQQNVLYSASHIPIDGYNGKEWRRLWSLRLPLGTFDWSEHSRTETLPTDIIAIRSSPAGGAGSATAPGITWFDDLKIYQDDKLIYENKFSNWLPYQIAGAVITAIPIGLYAARRMPKVRVPEEWWK